jgi:hypothetical protein
MEYDLNETDLFAKEVQDGIEWGLALAFVLLALSVGVKLLEATCGSHL